MELRHLRYFLAVATHLSFSRAAQALHMAQPPLSRQISTLERELDVRLFDRSRRNITLTEAGRLLMTEAQRLLDDLDRTAELVHRVGTKDHQRICVDFVPSAINAALPDILHEFRDAYPEVELVLHEGVPDQILESLRRGATDIGFMHLPMTRDRAIERELVITEPFMAALPAGHRLADAKDVALQELATDDFVLNFPFQGGGIRATIVQMCRDAGFAPRVKQEAWMLQTTLSLVSAGVGVSVVPASMQHSGHAGAVFKHIRHCTQHVGLHMLWLRDNTSPPAREFLGIARDWARRGTH